MANYLKPVAAVLIPNIGGFLGGFVTRKEVRPSKPGEVSWYMALKKPSFQPPSWLFAPVWTGLYCSMGYASYMIYRDGGGFSGDAALPLALYGTQLALNWAWSPLFFGQKKLGLALCENMLLWGSILATIVAFHQVNADAAHILLPYLGWVSFANFLNFKIWRLNKDRKD
ncbi:TSPO-like protein [Mya arenaria]|uniref:TSPO-like protein n=1 Tax=Mya arenaria TaxID=6604 RepID=A0ABY7EDH4_MYAAR|nr:translocator protein-like [Mya arenaria]WAR07920.1 TSPO-like protein [Mya arenaria]